MYGMVNQAVKEMVHEVLGEDSWIQICNTLKIKVDDFELFQQFDDEVTLNLVKEICQVSKMEPETLLESFGQYWVKYAQKSDYSIILSTFATSPFDLIYSLNNLHDRLELTFSNLNAPSFEIVHEEENQITVNYYSDRKNMGLEFFVKGLFTGIFQMFNQQGQVEIIETLGNANATFKIKRV